MEYVLFVIGFVVLIQGANWLIDGASLLSRKLGISDLIIGLTVVAFGTSLPELIVNIFAGAESGELAIGNVLGSNIANILLILGVASILHPLRVQRTTVYREIIFNVAAAGILAVLVSERLLSAGGFDGLDRIDGAILISYFVIFLYYTFGGSRASATTSSHSKEDESQESFNLATAILKIAMGATGLFFGGQWIVNGAIEIAMVFNVSDALIGLTIVAIGTSLPELAASVVAVRNKNIDIAVGNAVGSNLFNIFWVLGLSALINPLPFDSDRYFDVAATFIVAFALFLTMIIGKVKHQLTRREGIIFLIAYVAYLTVAVIRG